MKFHPLWIIQGFRLICSQGCRIVLFMTRRERMRAAMDLRVPDRVPAMCQMSIGHMVLRSGAYPPDLWLSAEAFAQVLVELCRDYAFDGILVSLHGHPPAWEKMALKAAETAEGLRVTWRDGGQTLFPFNDLPRRVTGIDDKEFPDPATFDPDSLPETPTYIPVSPGLRFAIDPDAPYAVFDMVRKAAGRDVSIHGEVTSPFDYLLDLFGFQAGLTALVDDPGRCLDILGRFARGAGRLAMGQVEHGVDAVKISSPYSGAGYISPAFYRRFVLPFEAEIVRAVRSRGAAVYLHTCGAIADRLELMASSGASGLECLDPPPLGDVMLGEAKERVGRRMFLKGNIDPVNVLLRGGAEVVERDILRCLEAGMPGGGFILSTACSIAPHTPPQNVSLVARLAEEFGRY